MLRESVDTCFVVMGALSQRLRALVGEIDNLTLHNAKSRVARYLLAHLAEERRNFDLDIPKGVLASRLSVTPETCVVETFCTIMSMTRFASASAPKICAATPGVSRTPPMVTLA